MMGGGIREISCGFVGDMFSSEAATVRTVEPPMHAVG